MELPYAPAAVVMIARPYQFGVLVKCACKVICEGIEHASWNRVGMNEAGGNFNDDDLATSLRKGNSEICSRNRRAISKGVS